MKITEKELLFLATVGASYQSEFCEDRKDFEKARRFNKVMKVLIEAENVTDVIKEPA